MHVAFGEEETGRILSELPKADEAEFDVK